MSDFKKLPCLTGCSTPSGFVDCNGDSISVGDAIARCEDIPAATAITVTNTVPGRRIATVNVDGVPTDIRETLTSLVAVAFDENTRTLSVTYKGEDGVEVTLEDNIPALDAVIHIGPAVITPPTKYPQYYNQIVTDGNGNIWAFSIDGTPTLLNITETVTTIIDVLTYANKHEIFKYVNESGASKTVYETVTAITGTLTSGTKIGTYTNENGDAVDIYAPSATTVSATAAVATGHTIGSVTVNGVTTTLKETITSVTDTVTGHKIGTYTDESGSTAAINETVTVISGTLTSGVKIGTYTNEAGTAVDIYAPAAVADVVTTMTEVVGGHLIGVYTNELGATVQINETVTALNSLNYNKATNVLTVTYTDEAGVLTTHSTVVKDQTNVFINGANPNSATIFSTTTPPSVNDNTLKQGTDYIYVGTDGSYWIWNGTAYVTAPVPAATTEWNVAGTNVDAKGDKVNRISRSGWVAIGRNIVPGVALEVQPTGTNQYYPLARFTNPDNKIVGYHTQLIFGVEQAAYNCSDWRFYYAGNNSTSNRIDFGMSGLVPPVISYNGNGNTGFNMTSPLSRADVNGSFGFAIRGSGGSATQGQQDGTVVFTVASSVYTLEAPSATVNARRFIAVKNNSTGNITVSGHIDGVAGVNQIIPSQGGAIYHTNGTSWYQIADNTPAVHARSSARINRGIDVTLDNLKFRVAATGNASLQVSTVTGTVTLIGTSSANYEAYGLVASLAVTTTPVYVRPALNLPNAGEIQRFLFVTSDNRSYEVRLVIAPGYTSNMIHIERLA